MQGIQIVTNIALKKKKIILRKHYCINKYTRCPVIPADILSGYTMCQKNNFHYVSHISISLSLLPICLYVTIKN